MGCFDQFKSGREGVEGRKKWLLGPFASKLFPSHGPENPPSSPVQQIVASETAGTKKKKKPFGQAQRPQDLGLLSLGTGGTLGGGYAQMDKARSLFG